MRRAVSSGHALAVSTLTTSEQRYQQRDPHREEVIAVRKGLARRLVAGLLGAALALGSFAPAGLVSIPAAQAADPGGAHGGGG